MHEIIIRTAPPQRLAAVPYTGPYAEIARGFEAFAALGNAHNLWPQLGAVVAVYFDDPATVPAAELRALTGAVFHGDQVPADMQRFDLHAGRTAVLTFKGPYSGLCAAADYIYRHWLPQSGEELADAPDYEIYLNDPGETAEEDLLTEICVPLKG
ncbi:MAG: GyrI-like domain-containing protein [Cellvibrionales bacterium]|nr:GyrI-like domain-containing protein [Cellvibrionales bacterium]